MNSTVEDIDQNRIGRLISSFTYFLMFTLPSNTYVLWMIQREARLATDIFYFNLSVEEVLFSMSIIWINLGYQRKCDVCFEVFAFFRGLFYTGRPIFQCLICLECYVGVNHPVLFLRLKPLRYRLTCCAVVWLLIALSCVYNKCTSENLRHLFTVFIQNLLILFVVLFCLLSVLRTLKRPGPGGIHVQKKSNRIKTRAIRILLVTMASLTVNFLLCVAPIPLQLCLPETEFLYVYLTFTCLSFVSGYMQLLIYLQRAEKILCFQKH